MQTAQVNNAPNAKNRNIKIRRNQTKKSKCWKKKKGKEAGVTFGLVYRLLVETGQPEVREGCRNGQLRLLKSPFRYAHFGGSFLDGKLLPVLSQLESV